MEGARTGESGQRPDEYDDLAEEAYRNENDGEWRPTKTYLRSTVDIETATRLWNKDRGRRNDRRAVEQSAATLLDNNCRYTAEEEYHLRQGGVETTHGGYAEPGV